MDKDLREAITDLKSDINRVRSDVNSKIDTHLAIYNQHAVDDATHFERLGIKVEAIMQESHDRTQTKIQWRLARYAAIAAIVAVLLGVFVTSIMNHLELRAVRTEQINGK